MGERDLHPARAGNEACRAGVRMQPHDSAGPPAQLAHRALQPVEIADVEPVAEDEDERLAREQTRSVVAQKRAQVVADPRAAAPRVAEIVERTPGTVALAQRARNVAQPGAEDERARAARPPDECVRELQ